MKTVHLVIYIWRSGYDISVHQNFEAAKETAYQIVEDNRFAFEVEEELSTEEVFNNWQRLTGQEEKIFVESHQVR